LASLLELAAAFDDSAYQAANPDVATRIGEGRIPSGWSHFQQHGFTERRAGAAPELADALRRITESGAAEPLPPPHLRQRVHGEKQSESFLQVGRAIALEFLHAVATHKPDLRPNARVLDFGCGCGRILRYLHPALPGCEFVGADIDVEAIAWNRAQLAHLGRFVANDAWPPLALEDQSVDVVYALSVFTHLPEDMQFAWLAELRRVIRKDGLLLLTVLGPDCFRALWKQYSAALERGWLWRFPAALIRNPSQPPFGTLSSLRNHRRRGFSFVQTARTPGLPGFYRAAYHNPQYIRDRWSKEFEILAIHDRGLGLQDLVVCRRRD
jgi:SAM-dependent methyltransferase